MDKTDRTDDAPLPRLYAVLAGINTYPGLEKKKQLEGCLNDVALIRELLEKDYLQSRFSEVDIRCPLLNEQATKANIADAIQTHLGKAGKDDFAFFFYSGHGIREATHIEAFQEEEVDANIGGILCYDYKTGGVKDPDDTVLCDKEFRYLIRNIAHDEAGEPKARVVAIFDCCHSGSHTRAVPLEQEIPARARQVCRDAIGKREWEGYIFHQDEAIKKKVAEKKPLQEILPEGQHIMMAACLEVELAWEADTKVDGQSNGAFTQALTEVLHQHQGNITYHGLHTRVLNRLRLFFQKGSLVDKRQTPQFYINSSQPGDRYKLFLTDKRASQLSECAVEHNAAEKEWRLSMGALHGVPPNAGEEGVKAFVFPKADKGRRQETSILQVFPMHSTIAFPEGLQPSEGPFFGEVEGLLLPNLQIFLAGEEEGRELAREQLEQYLAEAEWKFFRFADEEEEADYVLHAADGKLWLNLPFQQEVPLLRAVLYKTSAGALLPDNMEEAFFNLNQIAQWAFLKNVNYLSLEGASSPEEETAATAFDFRIYQYTGGGEEKLLFPKGNQLTFELTEEQPHAWLRFEVENRSRHMLYASLVFMSFDFGFYSGKHYFLESATAPVDRGETSRSRRLSSKPQPDGCPPGKTYIKFGIDNFTRRYNLQSEACFLKLLVSKTSFDLSSLHMDPLPNSLQQPERGKGLMSRKKEKEKPAKKEPEFHWEIRTLEIHLANPRYQAVNA